VNPAEKTYPKGSFAEAAAVKTPAPGNEPLFRFAAASSAWAERNQPRLFLVKYGAPGHWGKNAPKKD
jgi:hypothetical protein